MTTYAFWQQLARGATGEAFLDWFFSPANIISEPIGAQQDGYDRLYEPRDGSPSFTAEYKTDRVAARTNNAFVETVSVDRDAKRGWAYTSQAAYLSYFIPRPLSLVYVMPLSSLRAQLSRWERVYREQSVRNVGYLTKGRIVPLAEFEAI